MSIWFLVGAGVILYGLLIWSALGGPADEWDVI